MKKIKHLITDEGRECARCRIFKTWDSFSKSKHNSGGHNSYCKDCIREQRGVKKPHTCKINEEGRECSECGVFKTWDEFYHGKNHVNGHSPRCKECSNKISKKAIKTKIDRNGRTCSRCKEYKPWSEFHLTKSGTRGRRSNCKKCAHIIGGYGPRRKYRIDENGRQCINCKQYMPWDAFATSKGKINDKGCRCARCRKSQKIKHKYGITMDDYDRMCEKQNNLCAICGKPESSFAYGRRKDLSIDHDHKTGKVRGLLCAKCNLAIGYFEDSITSILAASTYLEYNRLIDE